MTMRVAFAGLGVMGSRMAANLVRAGHDVTVYNRTAERAADFAAVNGGRVASTAREAAGGADVVITMVSDFAALKDIYGGPAGILAGIRPGTVCVDMSTIAPKEVHHLADRAGTAGAAFLDAPVSGSAAIAEAGTLTIMVGGAAEEVARALPLLEAMGSKIYHVGALGRGATIKLAVNTVIYGLSQSLSEALVLAERAGIARETAYEVFANSAIAAPFVHYRRSAFERPGEVPVALRLVLERKDLLLVLDLAQHLDLEVSQARVNLAVAEAAIAAGYGDHDMSAVAEFLRHGSRTSE